MDFLTALRSRYATKLYNPIKPLTQGQIDDLKEILRLSPSSINSQPWHISFVCDKELKQELAEVSYFNKEKIIASQALVVFSTYSNVVMFEKWLSATQPEGAVAYYKNMVKTEGEAKIIEWFNKQLYLQLGVFLSGCAMLQIDSTPMEGIECEKYNKILKLTDFKAQVAVAVGYRDANDHNQPSVHAKERRELGDVVVVR